MRLILLIITSFIFSCSSYAAEDESSLPKSVFKFTPEVVAEVSNRLRATLESQGDDVKEKLAFELIGSDVGYNMFLVLRGNTGSSEIHTTVSDLHTAVEGRATLVLGGELVGEYELSPGQLRGTSIKGGTEFKLKAGDAVNIPANLAHHVVIEPGEQYMYFVYQVDSATIK